MTELFAFIIGWAGARWWYKDDWPRGQAPAAKRQRGYLATLAEKHPLPADWVFGNLDIVDAWDDELTVTRASQAIAEIQKRKHRARYWLPPLEP